ncbi:di-trans,poly-cis-decaprenylcistransferase [Curvibacter sp. CHRR-16]|uniref:polyprenyl diphosphate synthase n=1 Tax=Curvibacter sp. CHRR-16 TaxID=2835872 RepID=UPI001BDAA51A|nr:polyprenyl diphosphate synthase [Curvibacter sp. CHRR-16]MBT0570862.1 di-trans,poly-cis-decaprenylcistransferase [Curvibacter sp. CHRR-16]
MSFTASMSLHVAIVMDGNGRWATQRFLPRLAGHKQGFEALRRIVRVCPTRGIDTLTVFAFSSENWGRPADEVDGLMEMLANGLAKEVPQLHQDGVHLRFVGERNHLSAKVQKGLQQAEELTAANQGLHFNVCFNYGARWEIAEGVRRLQANGEAISETALDAALPLRPSRDPDLIIRTGGEYRLSNFLLWQAAYAELYFSSLLWPEFDEKALDAALHDFAQRERRYGKTSEQVRKGS